MGAQSFARSVIGQGKQARISNFASLAGTVLGWCSAQQGRSEQGIKMIREHLARYRAAGVRLMTNFYLGLLAEAEASAGSLENSLSAVDEALTVTPDHEV
jgi:predicted ATPase